MSVPPTSPAAPTSSPVTAQHPQCDLGNAVLHYLATGDSQGNMSLQMDLSSYVGASSSAALGVAKAYVRSCDDKAAQQDQYRANADTRASAYASEQASLTDATAARQAALTREQAGCTALHGKFIEMAPFADECYSGYPETSTATAFYDCPITWVNFLQDGSVDPNDLAGKKQTYPACWPK